MSTLQDDRLSLCSKAEVCNASYQKNAYNSTILPKLYQDVCKLESEVKLFYEKVPKREEVDSCFRNNKNKLGEKVRDSIKPFFSAQTFNNIPRTASLSSNTSQAGQIYTQRRSGVSASSNNTSRPPVRQSSQTHIFRNQSNTMGNGRV